MPLMPRPRCNNEETTFTEISYTKFLTLPDPRLRTNRHLGGKCSISVSAVDWGLQLRCRHYLPAAGLQASSPAAILKEDRL
jgi:hypothetical protein